MTCDAPPPNAAPDNHDAEPDWLEDLQDDLRRAAERPTVAPPRRLLGRLFDLA